MKKSSTIDYLSKKFKASPIPVEPGTAIGLTLTIPEGIEVENFQRYLCDVQFAEGEVRLFWLGKLSRSTMKYFRSLYNPDEVSEGDRQTLREMWRCVHPAPGETFIFEAESDEF